MRLIDADNLYKKVRWGKDIEGTEKVVLYEDVERELTVNLLDCVSERYGVPYATIETEVEFMRDFDRWLQENLDSYDWVCRQYARYRTETAMRKAGMPEKEIKEICDDVEKSYL